MPSVTMDTDARREALKVLKGRPRALPPKPRGDDDSDESKRYIRKVADLENPEEVIGTILGRARFAADYRRAFEDEWEQAIRAWFQTPSTEREDGWESDRFLPIIFKHHETALPSMVAATLDGHTVWKMVAQTPEGRKKALAQERLCNWQAYTTMRAEEAIEDMYWWSGLIGTAVVDTYWDWRVETRPWPKVRTIKDPSTGEDTGSVIKEVVEQEVTVADHPRMICLNPLDVWLDPNSEMGSDADWLVERVRTTVGRLREAAGEGHIDGPALETWLATKPWTKNQGSQEADWFHAASGDSWDELVRSIGYHGRDDDREDTEDRITGDKVVTLLRYRSKGEIVTLGSSQHIIGYSLNPYIHGKIGTVVHHFFKVPGCPYGRGVGTVLLDHQELANENINRWMDTAAVEAAAPIIVDRAALSIMDDEWVWEPNKILKSARGLEAARRMEVPAPTNLAMTLDSHLQRDADDVTGFTEQARGAAPPASQTATAFSGLQNNLRTRLVLHVRRAARTIRDLGELVLALNMQFMTETQVVQFIGEAGLSYVEVKPEEIIQQSVVRATLNASRANPELRANRLIQLTQVALPIIMQGGAQNPVVARWLRLLLDENEIEQADEILPRQQETPVDPIMENEALKVGVPVHAHPLDQHMQHIQAHGALLQEAQTAGLMGLASLVQAHIQEHLQVAAQAAGQLGPGAGGAPQQGAGEGMPTEGDPGQQAGGMTEGAVARNGTPGVAAPGPTAPPGRPM